MNAPNSAAPAWRPSPLVQMGIQALLGADPKHRQDLAELVCETLGVRPEFWREEGTPPVNLACVVRVGKRGGRNYAIGVFTPGPDGSEAGGAWCALHGGTIVGVSAWAEIPD